MWQLEDLRKQNMPMRLINGAWVPARPLNGRKEYISIRERIRDAWLVFSGRAEAFMWPEDAGSRPTPVVDDVPCSQCGNVGVINRNGISQCDACGYPARG